MRKAHGDLVRYLNNRKFISTSKTGVSCHVRTYARSEQLFDSLVGARE
jgi:hypothetical protein